jgi:pimeloyl-ACP methyl ester carboxylesterase
MLQTGLAAREQGDRDGAGPALVLLHGLTFDRRMWDPVLDALPEDRHAIAFDLPGHGASPGLERRGLAPVVDALHDAILDAGLDAPIVVGHSIAGPIASIYASEHPTSGVVSIEAPIRFEPFAEQLRTLGPVLAGDGFDGAWEHFRASMRMDLLTETQRGFLHERPSQELVLAYQADLLERPLDEVVRWRDEGMARVRRAGTPYLVLQANPVDPQEQAFLLEQLPQAEIVVWPVGHHFPHLADAARFAGLLSTLRVARRVPPRARDQHGDRPDEEHGRDRGE